MEEIQSEKTLKLSFKKETGALLRVAILLLRFKFLFQFYIEQFLLKVENSCAVKRELGFALEKGPFEQDNH